jgi:uncharacterized damage-inducible protein DinB
MGSAALARDLLFTRAEPAAAVVALQAQLRSLREVIERLQAEDYRSAPSGVSGSIGAHVRHCLDHVDALLTGMDGFEMTYDSRARGTAAETDPLIAMIEIDRLCVELDDLSEQTLTRPVALRSVAQRGRVPVRVSSTLGREVAFVIQHTIHHCAILAILLELVGMDVSNGFGYAPSTPRAEVYDSIRTASERSERATRARASA